MGTVALGFLLTLPLPEWQNQVLCRVLGVFPSVLCRQQQPFISDGRYLCREPDFDTRQRRYFAECRPADSRQTMPCRVSYLDTRQNIFLYLYFFQPNFLWCVPTLCRPTCSILAQL
jgi:hypothetical protein